MAQILRDIKATEQKLILEIIQYNQNSDTLENDNGCSQLTDVTVQECMPTKLWWCPPFQWKSQWT
jgi:hypothetical protein